MSDAPADRPVQPTPPGQPANVPMPAMAAAAQRMSYPAPPPAASQMHGQMQGGQAVWGQGPGWPRPPQFPPPPPRPSPFARYWPGPGRTAGAPRTAIGLIAVAAVMGAVGLVLTRPGFGWLLTAIALAALAVATSLARTTSAAASPPHTASPSPAGSQPPAVNPSPSASPLTGEQPTDTSPAAVPPPGVLGAPLTGAGWTRSGTVAEAEEAGMKAEIEPADDRPDDVEAQPTAPAPAAGVAASGSRTPVTISFAAHGERVFWGACALALVSVGTFRAAGWLFFWCVVFAFGCTAMSLAGGRTVRSLFTAVFAPAVAIFRAPAWIVRGFKSPRANDGPRIVIATAISVLLLLIFGGLFAGADAEFRHVLGEVLPPLRASEVARAIFCLVVVAAVGCGVAFLSAARPRFDMMEPVTIRHVRRAEWVLPLTVLNVLFAVFVFIQLTVLFGGDKSLTNASHAYMRGYAHNGFWQLLVVSVLTLTVLLVTSRIAPHDTPTDRTLLRVLLGGLAVFSIVIVLAALKRIAAYEHTYGYTRLRVVVAGVELWFGLLFVLILVAGITLRASWLPRVIAASLVLSLLAGAIANPDRYVAQQNVNRYASTGKLSIEYMRQLSADAVPAIDKLPPHLRACALRTVAHDLLARGDDWRTWNFPRVNARQQLYSYVKPKAGTCHAVIR